MICHLETFMLRTHNVDVITSHITELATLAKTWLAPSTYHRIYVVENNVVQAALKQNMMSLQE